MTESESHGVITTLKLFTLYELKAGVDYWGSKIMNMCPRPDVQTLCSTICYTEMGVHSRFYDKLNEALNLNTDEFYLAYKEDPVLKERMEFVEELLAHEDPMLAIGAFSMIEGAVLYSAFAFLLSFQAKGKNKLTNVCRGIKFSVRDENLHAIAGAHLFNQIKTETGRDVPEKELIKAAKQIQTHEHEIIDMLFEKGEMEGITKEQMKIFINSRINLCLENLGIEKQFDEEHNVIADWFYEMINTVQFNDFFSGIGSEYNRNWNEGGFSWEIESE